MNKVQEFINSGVLESYILGEATPEEVMLVEQFAMDYIEVRNELDQIAMAVESFARSNEVEPPFDVKPFLMAMIDYTERLQGGELPVSAPVLGEGCRIIDFDPWVNRSDFVPPDEFDEIYAKIISYTPELTTAVVWIKNEAPEEIHSDEFERFLILEGTCDIIVDGKSHLLQSGDFFEIPLHLKHQVKVTSAIPCKVILQRMAA